MNLYEQLETLATVMGPAAVPDYVLEGLPTDLELRPYQRVAISDFVRYLETEQLRIQRPTQVLFHMATGSGKTVVIAALILYLYGCGHRNFLFFVNSSNVLEKTRTNLLDRASSKYLFSQELKTNGKPLAVIEVENFQLTEPDAINVRFTTIQGLHAELTNPREGGLSNSDFDTTPVVFISDEAHHLNALTRLGATADEERTERSWEGSVNRVFGLNRENLLLEFTATCDLANADIAAKYADKIIADYPLRRFREDQYSKEIKLLQSELPIIERALQAMVLSQFRLKLFQKHGLTNKPVLLFKSKTIRGNTEFFEVFERTVAALDATVLEAIAAGATSGIVKTAFNFFAAQDISLDALAAEMRQDFDGTHCLLMDSKNISADKQLMVNSLESRANPIRAVFAVDMLNEGWDVLNLFDIVRLYDTRDARAGRPGKHTIQEAQLVGRGARYCPFRLSAEQDPYRRKYDGDLEYEMRACEELYFHSATNERYINELTTALKETGALPDRSVQVLYELKPEFTSSEFYREGWIFLNEREEGSRGDIAALPDSMRCLEVTVDAPSGATHTTAAFGDMEEVGAVAMTSTTRDFSDVAAAVLATAFRRNDRLRFDRLREKLPNLTSLAEFIHDASYLGGVKLTLRTPELIPTNHQWLYGAEAVLRRVSDGLEGVNLAYRGTRTFTAHPVHEKFTNRTCYVENPTGDGVGIAQREVRRELRLLLDELDWYAYTENFGTTEEKRFLVYLNDMVDRLRADHSLVRVLRNERQIGIYDFDTGRRFEPDFLLFLQKKKGQGFEQFQIFVEPKGLHLADVDRWKESLMLRLENEAEAVKKFADDGEYLVWGMPFFTHESPEALHRFTGAMGRLLARTGEQ